MSDGLIDVFGARAPLKVGNKQYVMYRLDALQKIAGDNLARCRFR